MSKTRWQWAALILYFVGLLALIPSWMNIGNTKAWAVSMSITFISWLIAILIIIVKPNPQNGDKPL